MSDLSEYRENVGVVVFNREGRVWLGRRAHTPPPYNWQFPQGGVDPGEELEAAARRELHEETGITSVSPLARTQGWIAYDFPPELRAGKRGGRWRGQKQAWFAFLFEGEEEEIDLEGHHQVEFDAWRWAALGEAADLVVPFKRQAYLQVIEAFARLAAEPGARGPG